MSRNLYVLAFWVLMAAAAHAGCTPQAQADLQGRGASAAMIAQMCGSASGGPQPANVCITKFGVCPFNGVTNVACTCKGQLGSFPGTSR